MTMWKTGHTPIGAIVLIGAVTFWPTTVSVAGQQPQTSLTNPERFGFGEPVAPATIEALDIDVTPDGTGLPDGQGTAQTGANTYQRLCAGCHGPGGEGATANRLVGAEPKGIPPFGPEYAAWLGDRPDAPFTIGNYWPYATTLFDYIRRAMPTTAPGSLSPNDVYGLTAWLLARNAIIADDEVMNAQTLPAVRMPALDLFVPDDRLESTSVR